MISTDEEEEMSEELEQIFVSLVNASWQRYNEQIINARMDDLLVGAVIASTVETGYSLIDLNTDGINHYLRFEHLPTKQRLIFQLKNLAEDLVTAKVLGRHARVVIGHGRMVENVGTLWSTLKAEIKSSFLDQAEPGVITCDADMAAGYIYAQIPLIMDLDQYFSTGWQVNYTLLQTHINATVQALSKYLNGRLAV
jgi:hypothetical protein